MLIDKRCETPIKAWAVGTQKLIRIAERKQCQWHVTSYCILIILNFHESKVQIPEASESENAFAQKKQIFVLNVIQGGKSHTEILF